MRRALLSNVHGDVEALEAVLRNIDVRNDRGAGIEEILFLGNVVGLGPRPRECLELAKKRGTRVLAGRQERALLRKATQPGWAINAATGYPEPGAREGILWTIHQIFGDPTRVQADDAPTRDFLLDLRAPDFETRLAREVAGKLDHIPELKTARLADLLTHVVGRGLVLKFIHRTRLRREGEDWLAWIKELPATLKVDDLELSETSDAGSVGLGATATYAVLKDGKTRLVRVPLRARDVLLRDMQEAGLRP
ncbi:MAG TPA: hypothetical protein VF950_23805 [Planctomycetota bacterium]